MSNAILESEIEAAWNIRDTITPSTKGKVREAIEETLEALDKGELRVAEKTENNVWKVNQWAKKAVLLGFRIKDMEIQNGGPQSSGWWDKVDRKFDLVVDIFGADHTDTYPDVLSALNALDINTEHIKILIYQFVTLIKNGEKVKMSTRKADFITLDHLIDELGLDIVRYFFIMRSMNTHLDFDLDVAKDQSEKNPVFYLQYAYARICNIIKRADEVEQNQKQPNNNSLLVHKDEMNMLKHMVRFPEIIDIAYENLEPQHIANYLQQLASYFHKFYSQCKVINENE